MNILTRLILIICKFTRITLRLIGRGGGTALPGLIAQKLHPNILQELATQVKCPIICISGTDGKTTTSNTLQILLSSKYSHILHNRNGSNLERGIISAFIQNSSIFGQLRPTDVIIAECDEAALPSIVAKIHPTHLLFTNLFRDQLDRYGEIESTRSKWQTMLEKIDSPTTIIYNAADPQLHFLFHKQPNSHLTIKHILICNTFHQVPAHSPLNPLSHIHCPQCNQILQFTDEIILGQGSFSCASCHFTNLNISPLAFDTITYKTINKILAQQTVFHLGVPSTNDTSIAPVFGRGESIQVGNAIWNIILIKNPNGAYQAIKESQISSSEIIVFALNDKFADGTDISWIWDIPLEELNLPVNTQYFTTGTRHADMSLRLKYLNLQSTQFDSWEYLFNQNSNNVSIFTTYTALLNLQNWLAKNGYKKDYWK